MHINGLSRLNPIGRLLLRPLLYEASARIQPLDRKLRFTIRAPAQVTTPKKVHLTCQISSGAVPMVNRTLGLCGLLGGHTHGEDEMK